MSQNTPRPLAPAVPHAPAQISPKPTPPALVSTRQRRNITTACKACRKRRSKCDDNTPCSACVLKQTECVRDQGEDGRRKIAWKRKVEELESGHHLTPQLLEAIRNGDMSEVDKLIALIRSKATQEEIVDFIATNFSRETSGGEESETRSRTSSTRQRSRSVHRPHRSIVPRDFDSPLISVPAIPWTTVTDDDQLVSDLISLWFTWRHWCYPFVDRERLIAAMQSKISDDTICTPYLVNMILSDACFDYDYPVEMNSKSSEKPLRDLFYTEARRLAEAAGTHRSVPSIQYRLLKWAYLDNLGMETMSLSVMHDALHHLQQLDKPGRLAKFQARAGKDKALEVERSVVSTSWTTFIVAMRTTFSRRSLPLMPPPLRDNPPPCKGQSRERWVAYPRQHSYSPAHSECHLHYLGKLAEIFYKISRNVFFPKEKPAPAVSRDLLEDLHRELVYWHDNLMDCLQVDGTRSPHIYSLHAQYHWAVVVLSELNFTLPIDDEDESTLAMLTPVIRMQHMTAILEIAGLVHRNCMDWGVDHIPISFLHPIHAAIVAIMNDLDPAEHRSAFTKLAVAFHCLSRRSTLAEGMLRILQLDLRRRRLMASNDIKNMFKEANDLWEASAFTPPRRSAGGGGGGGGGGVDVLSGRAIDGTSGTERIHVNTGQRQQFGSGHGSGAAADDSYDLLIEKWNHFNLGTVATSSSSSSSSPPL
ncbi:Notoamide biosynthesis transcriptional activator notL' [Exophiala dermatitidis]